MATQPTTAAEALARWRQNDRFSKYDDPAGPDLPEIYESAQLVVELAKRENVSLESLGLMSEELSKLTGDAAAHEELERREDEGWPAVEDPPYDDEEELYRDGY